MRVLLYTTSPRGVVGGMEAVFANLTDGLRDRGHRVDTLFDEAVSVHIPGVKGDTWALPLARLRTWRKLPKPGSVYDCVRSVLRVARVLAHVRPEVVNVHYVDTAAAYFALLRPVFGYRLVLSAHGSDLLRPHGSVQRLVLPPVLRRADAVVTVSEALTRRAAALGVEARTVLNGVDYEFWSTLPRAEADEGVVVAVGRLHRVKGQDVLIEGFARLGETVPHARLWLIGDGEERPALEELTRRHGLEHRVRFLGSLGREEVRAVLARAGLFVLPSRSEGLSIALLEAMASGLPVVATDVGGIAEVIRDGTEGVLVPSEDAPALADAVCKVLSDSGRREHLSRNGRERARSFSLARTLDAYEALFQDLVGEGGGSR
jgi:glycosyltransferase involved in cell wall biosynthesis